MAVTAISFAALSLHKQMIHQTYTVFAAFILYLLLRFTYRRFLWDKLTAIVVLLVGVAGIESARGLFQFLSNSHMRGLFHNINHSIVRLCIYI